MSAGIMEGYAQRDASTAPYNGLEAIEESGGVLRKRIYDVSCRLSVVLETLRGAVPQAGIDNAKNPEPCGRTSRIANILTVGSTHLNEIEKQLNELEALVGK